MYISAFSSGGGAGKLNVIWDNPNFSGADLQAISQKIQAYMSANQVPGLALAITKDGRLVYAAGFGYANKETGEEAAPTNMWRIASVSKNITSTAIMKLVEKGSLHLTDNVFGPGSLLGAQFPTPAGNKKIEQIKVKHLLEHVSGLSNTNGDPMFMNTGMNHTQLISWMLNDPGHKMTRDANTQFEYLNFGYCLLGRIIEKVSGQSYDEFVKQNVLGASGVTEMAIGANSEAAHKPREVKYYPGIAYSLNVTRFDSHGGWVASPIDLVRYVVRVDGLPTKPDIFTAASHTAVTTDSGIKDANGNDPNYGFGWGLPQWHNGDIDGSIAFSRCCPEATPTLFWRTRVRPTMAERLTSPAWCRKLSARHRNGRHMISSEAGSANRTGRIIRSSLSCRNHANLASCPRVFGLRVIYFGPGTNYAVAATCFPAGRSRCAGGRAGPE